MSRKNIRTMIMILFATLMMLLTAVAASADTATIQVGSTNVTFSIPSTLTFTPGQTKTVQITQTPSNAPCVCDVQWGKSMNYVNYDAAGGFGSYWNQPARAYYTGVGKGVSYINVTVNVHKNDAQRTYVGKVNLSCKATVVDNTSTTPTPTPKPAAAATGTATATVVKNIPLKSISLNLSSKILKVGESAQLKVFYNPSNTTSSKTAVWTSSASSVVSVVGGKITAKKPGTAVITAKVGTKTAICKVQVNGIPLSSISLNKTNITLTKGEDYKLSVSYKPSNTTDNKNVTWTSSAPSVATVSGGKIVAKGVGSTVIKAKVGSKTASCKVTVKSSIVVYTPSTTSASSGGSYKNVSDAYTMLNTFRTTKTNQWYWNKTNTAKVTTYGLKPLKRDVTLENLAKSRAKEQWTQYYVNGKITHDRLDGSPCETAYPVSLRNRISENLAWGYPTAKDVIFVGWAETNKDHDGQGHRINMLNNIITKVGIACYVKDGKTCWAMCLAY